MTTRYIDSSALVKLIVVEPDSDALRGFLSERKPLVSSALTRTETLRAVAMQGPEALDRARQALRTIDLVAMDEEILGTAGVLEPTELRTLDAIHLATALAVADELDVVVTYDVRMARAAETVGLRCVAPR